MSSKTRSKAIDVLGLGFTAVDELLYVDNYPAADNKIEVRRHERQCGGLTATALMTAASMNCRCAYAGILGDCEQSTFAIEQLQKKGVDISHMKHQVGALPVRSTIIIDQCRHTRTIFYEMIGVEGPDATWPCEDIIRNSKVLLVDHCGIRGMVRAAQIARDAGIPVVADIEDSNDPLLPKLLELSDHLILSRDFALKLTGENDAAAAATRLWHPGHKATVVTCGAEGCWYVTNGQTYHQPSIKVSVVDTTGCGDVFHGAYAAALVHNQEVPTAIRFASVVAGLKAMSPGGQSGIPSRTAVETLLQEQQIQERLKTA